MRSALTIAAKDLKLRVRDRSAFIVGIIAPLGLAFIFNAILGDLGSGALDIRYGVLDLDGGATASQLVATLEDIERQGVFQLDRVDSDAAASDLVDSSELSAVFVIPSGFSSAVEARMPATLEILGDVDQPTAASIAAAIGGAFASEIRTVQLSVATVVMAGVPGPPAAGVDDIGARAASVPPPVTIGSVEAATRELDLTTFFVAGMAIFFLFFTVQFGVLSLLEERKFGTMARLLGAPVPRLAIIAAKGFVSFTLGAVSMAVLVVSSIFLLDAQWGDPLGVTLLVLAAILSAVGLMALVAAFAKTPEAAGNIQAIVAVGLGMLGGIFFPATLGEGLIAKLSYISPHRWFMVGLADLAGGGGIGVIGPSLMALLGIGVAGGVVAYFRLREGMAA